jgi:hypothetical protein
MLVLAALWSSLLSAGLLLAPAEARLPTPFDTFAPDLPLVDYILGPMLEEIRRV